MDRSIEKQSRARAVLAVTMLVAALAVSGCGGGDVYVDAPPFDIHVMVAGQPLKGVVFAPGPLQRVSMRVGQSIELSASERVTW